MNGTGGHILAAVFGALLAGILCSVMAPGLFWAGLICGALTGAALRVGYVLITADDGGQEE